MNPIEQIVEQNKLTISEHIVTQAFNRGYLCALLHLKEITLSDSANINAFGSSVWFTIYNREDLEALLRLETIWGKQSGSNCLIYTTRVHDRVEVQIHAYDAALPPTCKLVEITEEVPARTITRMVVQCDQPATAETPSSVTT